MQSWTMHCSQVPQFQGVASLLESVLIEGHEGASGSSSGPGGQCSGALKLPQEGTYHRHRFVIGEDFGKEDEAATLICSLGISLSTGRFARMLWPL